MTIFLVALGGFLGAIARFSISQVWNKPDFHQFHGTILVNILGSAILAAFFLLLEHGIISFQIWALGGIGFCGAFTTFSTFGMEAVSMIQNQQYRSAFQYVSVSFLASILIISLILWIGM
ncbi:fluoride efflux transporter FluC [Radiobacillus deserti]|uniref:Fluoride-specific ion channel FluC n=1 Tax=Radiobacillus deserti TaxID=2594883 RepID=A0A516KI08_9BACI|nr:CrcB family protein [Radiobacillus deserti]QDP41022.1 CrcB family protein [Radiobacillus deserti]